MAVDYNILSNFKTVGQFGDVQRANENANQLAQSQIQTGNIEALTKKNAYATQVLSAAASPAGADDKGNPVFTGDNQSSYDAAKQHLQGLGIDVSSYAPDVQTGSQQLFAARQAASPYGTLFNAQQKVIGNNIAAAGLGLPNGGMIQPIPQIGGMLPVVSQQPSAVNHPIAASLVANAPTQPTQAMPIMPGKVTADDVFNSPAPLAATPNTSPLKFNFRPQAANETLPMYKAAQQQAFEEFKLANTSAIKKAEEVGKTEAGHVEAALGGKDILRLYNKIGNEAANVPGGMIENVGANLANAANIPSKASNARGTFDADLNNLYLATIRSMASTGRVMKAEIEKIGEAAPQQNDPTGVKISKVNAHLEDYNQRMKDMGFNPSTGKELQQGEQPKDVPLVQMPGNKNLPTITSPQDPAFQRLSSGAQFIGPDGVPRTKH